MQVDAVARRIDHGTPVSPGEHETTASSKAHLARRRRLVLSRPDGPQPVDGRNDEALDRDASETARDRPSEPSTAGDIPPVDEHLVDLVAADSRPRERQPEKPRHE